MPKKPKGFRKFDNLMRKLVKVPNNATTVDVQWLHDCGWSGWIEELGTGKIITHHGDEFLDAASLRTWLMNQQWPEPEDGQREIPKRL